MTVRTKQVIAALAFVVVVLVGTAVAVIVGNRDDIPETVEGRTDTTLPATLPPETGPATTVQCDRRGCPEGGGNGGGSEDGAVDSGNVNLTPLPDPIPAGVYPLGQHTMTGDSDPNCPAGWECPGFNVSCPDLDREQLGWYQIGPAQGEPKGVIVFFSGGGGTDPWTAGQAPGEAFLADMQATGYEVVVVKWRQKGWLFSTAEIGAAKLACRPATAVSWAYENRYLPMGEPGGTEVCGFCITGNSGGASQVSYAVSYYGLDTILDGVFPTSGPVHAALAKGCLRVEAERDYWYLGASGTIDGSYGFTQNSGPCTNHDANYVANWLRDGISSGGSDYTHPSTRIKVFIGSGDHTPAPAQAQDWLARLRAEGSPFVDFELVQGMPHDINESSEALARLKAAILGD